MLARKIETVTFNYFLHEWNSHSFNVYAVDQKKKRNTLIYFNANYRTEVKLIPIIMDYCLLQFDALKFF